MMSEKDELEERLEKLKKGLSDYLKVSPVLWVSEEEKKRTINIFLDDISKVKKEIERRK